MAHEYWTDFKRNPFMWIIDKPRIGANTWIGPFTVLDGSGNPTIGKNCSISAGVHVYTHEMITRNKILRKPVVIGDRVYVGANAVIMIGSRISDDAVVGAGAIVLKNTIIKRGETWVGCPARRKK